MRINLLFGFLGSGKTTLARNLLMANPCDQKMAVIVNEFGDVGIDGTILKGREEGPGRPLMYRTTDEFLESFGLSRLAELPKLKEISEILNEQPALTQQIDAFK